MGRGYLARHLSEVAPVPCPCGQSWRIFTRSDGPVANIHVTSIQDSRRHYHKNCTEFYYVLEGEGTLEVGDDQLALTPGLLVRIDANTPHRGHGNFKSLIVGVPAWDPEDEWFT
jgi:mannose-6-phosphate isomerase-like protein (cupin superfamily)